jgi:hypothetical protein
VLIATPAAAQTPLQEATTCAHDQIRAYVFAHPEMGLAVPSVVQKMVTRFNSVVLPSDVDNACARTLQVYAGQAETLHS